MLKDIFIIFLLKSVIYSLLFELVILVFFIMPRFAIHATIACISLTICLVKNICNLINVLYPLHSTGHFICNCVINLTANLMMSYKSISPTIKQFSTSDIDGYLALI